MSIILIFCRLPSYHFNRRLRWVHTLVPIGCFFKRRVRHDTKAQQIPAPLIFLDDTPLTPWFFFYLNDYFLRIISFFLASHTALHNTMQPERIRCIIPIEEDLCHWVCLVGMEHADSFVLPLFFNTRPTDD